MKTRITLKLKKKMGLVVVNGQITDCYGRTFETYQDDQGYEDIRPNGVQKDMQSYYRLRQQQGI